ncbi:MAG: tetratricopeptide repeat protein, partial [Candidatus Heimdallarchaeota archaeon]|nr:tetratricopeptide repeat protein [Candidatus Heimdallarchaeota archaeon]
MNFEDFVARLYKVSKSSKNVDVSAVEEVLLQINFNQLPSHMQAMFLVEKAYLVWMKGDMEQLNELISSASNIFSSLDTTLLSQERLNAINKSQGTLYYLRGNIFLRWGKDDQAMDQFKASLAIKESVNDLEGISSTLNKIGILYDQLSKYDAALDVYQKMNEIEESIQYRGGSRALSKIAGIYLAKNQVDKALEYANKSLQVHENIKEKSGLSLNYGWLGVIYLKSGKYQLALENCQKEYQLEVELENEDNIAESLVILGEIFHTQGNLDTALKHFQQALEIMENRGFISGDAWVLNCIGNVYLSKNDYNEALRYHKLAFENKYRKILSRAGNILEILDTLALMEQRSEMEKYIQILEEYSRDPKNEEEKSLKSYWFYGKALYLKMSIRSRDKVEAEKLFEEVIARNEMEVIFNIK